MTSSATHFSRKKLSESPTIINQSHKMPVKITNNFKIAPQTSRNEQCIQKKSNGFSLLNKWSK